ncbi:MAG TPA: hypothetical protein PKM35_03710 [Holophaga sp.]|nr:hypothetical protein [Holophaga sp.]HPS68126.1 hypothetical protein [Holophaga sp.]
MKTYRFRGKPNRKARKAGKMALRRHARLTDYLANALPVCIPKVVYVREGDTLTASIQTGTCKAGCPRHADPDL